MDVFDDMTLNDIKALVQDEIGVEPAKQHFLYNQRPISDTTQTLTQVGLTEGDMLGMAIGDAQTMARRRQPRQQRQPTQQSGSASRGGVDPERLRLHIIGDAAMMAEVRRQDPQLADAAHDQPRFLQVWQERQRQAVEAQAEKDRQYALLNADPFNLEAQQKIEEMIQQERIQENVQKALEENPESFGRVNMLYIDCLVNNQPIKAFVDSGAQTTIMSPSAAERCGIMRLVDRRYGGIAKGVGTAIIIGRVHSAEIQIGQYSLASSFTVMEGKDVDLLLGLDMLKRHQMCIDLRKNALVVQQDEIQFLPENEIPKAFEEQMEDEPKMEGPGGTQIGTRTGTVEPSSPTQGKKPLANGTQQSKINIHPTGSAGNVLSKNSTATSSSAPIQQPGNRAFGYGQPQQITKESIDKITDLGFTREEAIQALQQVNGDVEQAVGLLL